MRRLFIDKIENMRDIGGYSIDTNIVVKSRLVIRSNLVQNISSSDLDILLNKGFTNIIDLRNKEEVKNKKSVFQNNPKFNYKHIPIKGDGKLPNEDETVLDTYIEMLSGKEQIGEVFQILSNSQGGIIYYCNAGKDRTGVITAILLKLLGVNEKEIALDYIASGIFLKESLEDYAKTINNKNILSIIIPKEETIFNLLRYIDDNYCSVENYLIECGLNRQDIDNIKNKYIESAY